jgi:hypothetical protein
MHIKQAVERKPTIKQQNMDGLESQFNEMLASGTIPVIEFEMNNKEYLTVDLGVINEPYNRGITFEFDANDLPVHFDGDVRSLGGGVYLIPNDEYFEGLNHYLELAYVNVTEGYLIPNGLYL